MTDSQWTVDRDLEAIRILSDVPDVLKDRRYYHVRETFELVEVAGIRRVRRKKDQKIMAASETFVNIIRDMHVAAGHKGERKTHKKISEHYSNIPMSAVKEFITNCERCAEKAKKKNMRGVVVRPILTSALND